MAITDDQMEQLRDFARQAGEDGVHAFDDPSDQTIIDMVFDWAQLSEGMVTQDEYAELVTEMDMPAPEDRADILAAWKEGDAIFERRYDKAQRDMDAAHTTTRTTT